MTVPAWAFWTAAGGWAAVWLITELQFLRYRRRTEGMLDKLVELGVIKSWKIRR